MKQQYFVSGIGTEVGKTIVSAILVQALKADYWKPIQSGDLDNSDSQLIEKLTKNSGTKIHPETHRLKTPASPHYSAAVDGVSIQLDQFQLPKTNNNLIVEGAGGLIVPLNDKDSMLDLIEQLKLPVILVANFYLGSINHSLLSLEVLKQRNISIHSVIFNGDTTVSSRDIIKKMSGDFVERYIEIPRLNEISLASTNEAAHELREKLL